MPEKVFLEGVVELARNIAFEAADDVAPGVALVAIAVAVGL